MLNRRFMFNSPALFNLGIDMIVDPDLSELIYDKDDIGYEEYKLLFDKKSLYQMCFACFVIPVDDSLEGIFSSVKNAALISMKGGGVGTNFGRTREKGSDIRYGQGGKSSGPISWMKQWETMAEEVVQGGRRRAALMGLMDINHPDIEEFISCKDEDNVLSYFNLSVSITDEFMDAVKNNKEFRLRSRIDPSKDKIVNARELWDKICTHAWKRGDPGIHFVDRSNQDSLLKLNKNWTIEATNPCGEMNLPFKVDKEHYNKFTTTNIGCTPKEYPIYESDFSEGGTSCNLGSINLVEFIDSKDDLKFFNFEKFGKQIHRSIYYLDLIIDVSEYPLEGIEKNTKAIRPVGLGVMGVHDIGIILGLPFKTTGNTPYQSLCTDIAKYLGMHSLIASIDIISDLKKEPFDQNKCVGDLIKEYFISKNFNKEEPFKYIEDIYKILKEDEHGLFLPPSLRRSLIALFEYDKIEFEKVMRHLVHGEIRNSRKNSIAPTGCLSINSYISSSEGLLRFDEIYDINSSNQWNNIDIQVEQENGIVLSNKFYINGLQDTKKIKLKSGLELESTYNHQFRILDENNQYSWRRAEDLKIGDRMVYKIGEYNKTINPKFDFSWFRKIITKNNKDIIFPTEMNEDLAFFIGVYCGNGNRHGSKQHHNEELRISFNINHTKKIKSFEKLVKRLFNYDIKYNISDTKPNISIKTCHIRNAEIIEKLEYIGILKKNSRSIVIPKIIRESSKDCIKAFVNGYWIANGSKYRNNKYIDTISKQMAQELLILMRMVGINGSISVDSKRNRIYMNQYGSDSFVKEHERFISLEKRENHKLLSSISDRLYTDEIVSIENSKSYTYDIQVPENNTYIANSYISHNTISLICDVSSGVEPNFAYKWTRRINTIDENGNTVPVVKEYTHRFVPERYLKELDETGTISNPIYKSALEIDPIDHMGVVSIFAKYVDCAISKCVAKGTRIQTTNKGEIAIENFSSNRNVDTFTDISNLNIKVRDMNGNEQKVLSHYYGGIKKTIIIKFDNMFELECSENHRLMTEYGWKKASEITLLDKVKRIDDNGNRYFIGITKILRSENEVFDIEVENTHSYLISGFVSHNTINLPNSATVEDIKDIYMKCHEMGIKGITIYRDGSRSFQPLSASTSSSNNNDSKQQDHNLEEIIKNISIEELIDYIKKDSILLNKLFSGIKNNNSSIMDKNENLEYNAVFGTGSFINIKTPYGTIYFSGKFDENDRLREVFITLNKSGQELKAITEALSRLVSIILQESSNYITAYRRIVKTLNGIGGFEAFVYDGLRSGKEYIVKSIPDLLSYVIPDLEYVYMMNKYDNDEDFVLNNMVSEIPLEELGVFSDGTLDGDEQLIKDSNEEYIEKYNNNKGLVCPECGGTNFYMSEGCNKCLSCGHSKCSVG